ncbi:MAG: LmeA family phospholipid-binding protein [Candidatus Rokubacteria bacterium]|nr:LmeA family phospholipid-binding protein [Candidatus Rokubacteria bacterium]
MKSRLLLTGLVAALVLVVGIWVALDRRPPVWDHANHLERSVVCWRLLSERGMAGVGQIVEMSSFYPPLVPCAAGLLYLVFGVTPLTSQALMLVFLGLALVSLFLLGRRLFDAPTGVLAALLFGTAPFVVYSATNFQLDLPLAAAAIFTLLVLVKTEAFSQHSWSIGLGLAVAFGMWVKPPFAIFLLPPLGLVAWRALRAGGRGRRVVNLALAVLLGGALSLPWYGLRVFGLPIQVANRAFKQAAESGYPETLTPASLFFYPKALLPTFGLLAGLLFVWGFLALARQPAVRGLLWSAAVVPFGVFVSIQNKNLRYVLPLLPVAALIAAAGLRAVGPAWRPRLTLAVVVVSVLQVGTAAFGILPVPPWTPFNLPIVFSFPPSSLEWPHRQVLDVIVRESRGAPATVSVVPNFDYFSVSNFRYYAVRDGLPLELSRAWDRYPLRLDFIILKTGNQGPEFSIAKPKRIMERLAAGDPAFERIFPVIWEAPLPDGSVAIVRQRRLTPVTGVSPPALAHQFEEAVARFLEPYAREVEGLKIDLDYSPRDLLRGEIRRVLIEARTARVAEFARQGAQLRLGELRLTLEGVVVNPHRLIGSGEIEPLEVERLRVDHLVVAEQDLRTFLSGLRRLGGLRLGLEEGAVTVALAQPGPDVTGRLRLLTGGGAGPLAVHAEQVRLGGIPLPDFLVGWVFRHYDPAPRLAKLPMTVELGQIRVEPGRIVIADTAAPPMRSRGGTGRLESQGRKRQP